MPKSTEVRSHGNNVRDVNIKHVISADAQIYIYLQTWEPQSNLRTSWPRVKWLVKTMKLRIYFNMVCAHKHLLTNTLMTIPFFVIKPKAITKAAVPSSGYIGNCSSITVSWSIVITHFELCRA